MSGTHKFFCPQGCCICATKHSSSQFRPWYEHYCEETYCRVFRLTSLGGRRNLICNPCVLYIKRAITSLDCPTEEQIKNPPDHTQRIDCKLKGDIRPPLEDLWPPDMCGGELGFSARNMRVYPRYVMLGKPYFKLQSKFQLVPAGFWQDPRDYLEDEDDAARDLPFYRITTLPFGVKTIQQKRDEKKRKDLKENERLFGKVTDKTHNQTKHQRVHRTCLARSKRRSGKRTRTALVKVNDNPTAPELFYNGSSKDDPEEEEECDNDYDDDATDSSDEIINDLEAGVSLSAAENKKKVVLDLSEQLVCVPPKKRKYPEDDFVIRTPATEQQDKLRCLPAAKQPRLYPRTYSVNRRFPKTPIKNRRMRKVSFFDCSYWQKFQFCCFDLYAGEGGIVVTCLHDMKGKTCMVREKQTARRNRARQQPIEAKESMWQICDAKDASSEESCRPFTEKVCHAFAEGASRQPLITESASESSQSLEESSGDAYTSEQLSVSSEDASIRVSNSRYTPSPPLSSGGDDRGNVTSSPVLEKALTDPMFNWAPAQLGYHGRKMK